MLNYFKDENHFCWDEYPPVKLRQIFQEIAYFIFQMTMVA